MIFCDTSVKYVNLKKMTLVICKNTLAHYSVLVEMCIYLQMTTRLKTILSFITKCFHLTIKQQIVPSNSINATLKCGAY